MICDWLSRDTGAIARKQTANCIFFFQVILKLETSNKRFDQIFTVWDFFWNSLQYRDLKMIISITQKVAGKSGKRQNDRMVSNRAGNFCTSQNTECWEILRHDINTILVPLLNFSLMKCKKIYISKFFFSFFKWTLKHLNNLYH